MRKIVLFLLFDSDIKIDGNIYFLVFTFRLDVFFYSLYSLPHTIVYFNLDGDVFPAIALILVEHSDITRLRFANCHHTKVEMISG